MDRQRQSGDEGEVSAQLQQEPRQLSKDGRLQVPLAMSILQPQEVQGVRVLEDLAGYYAVRPFRASSSSLASSSGFLEMAVRS